jgi:hypothetical protein
LLAACSLYLLKSFLSLGLEFSKGSGKKPMMTLIKDIKSIGSLPFGLQAIPDYEYLFDQESV